MGEHAYDVGLEDFDVAVLEKSRQVPVVVDFWAEWCGPCRTLGPVLEQLAAAGGGQWVLAKVDVDANPELSGEFGVQGIPAVKAFRDGQVVAEFVGAQPRAFVENWLRGLVPSLGDAALTQALAKLREEVGNVDAAALEERILADAADHEARYTLALARAAAGAFETALGHLLEIVRKDRKFRDDGARKAMLRLFEIAGARSAVSDRWRDRLAAVLY